MAKTELKNQLVHVDYNIKYLIEKKQCEHYDIEMQKVTMSKTRAFDFDLSQLYNDENSSEREEGLKNLRLEMLKATPDNPLFIIVAGAYHFVYEAAFPIKGRYNYANLIQHSPDNANNTQGGSGKMNLFNVNHKPQ